ncbi:MAG: exopolysaccharide biosynthesis polyprenyl glycosylphosphotransferase [Nanoarchaeota archaeon]|nr:exopolysaccharide biosynthesis polyprenyl glycosylphosphotransferase [Nanoarchaeota archaeon]
MAHRLFLLFADTALLYASLGITLLIRYEAGEFSIRLSSHLLPFSLLFLGWLLVFFIADLYSLRLISSPKALLQRLSSALFINLVLSVFAFYLFGPLFSLAPKTNLFIFGVLSFLLLGFFRLLTLRFSPRGRVRVLFIGTSRSLPATLSYLKDHPHLGYHTASHIPDPSLKKLQETFSEHAPDLVVFCGDAPPSSSFFGRAGLPFSPRISFLPFQNFYVTLFEKVSLPDIDEAWVMGCVMRQDRAYDIIKRSVDILLSLPLLILFSLPMALLATVVRATSPGKVLFSQKRMGRGSHPFTLYKFRTMYAGSEGPLWTERNDPRITPFGRFLRFTHLDELPQLFNILRGDISFTGPRPERYELAEKYRALPYYDLRHLVKPGLTGWAQINFRPSASLEEAEEKLAYDLYYIAYRSFTLDLVLFVKTLRHFFFSHS